MKPRLNALLGVVLLAGGHAYAADLLAAAGGAVTAGDYSAALADLNRLSGPQADEVTARFLRGTALAGDGKLDQAATVFEKLIDDYPKLPEPYNNLAAIYARQGRLDDAKNLLERALHTDSRYATIYENLSAIYVQMARASYAKALRIESADQPPALQVLATLKAATPPAPTVVASAEPVAAAPESAPKASSAPPAPKPASPPSVPKVVHPKPVAPATKPVSPAPAPEPASIPSIPKPASPAPQPASTVSTPKPAATPSAPEPVHAAPASTGTPPAPAPVSTLSAPKSASQVNPPAAAKPVAAPAPQPAPITAPQTPAVASAAPVEPSATPTPANTTPEIERLAVIDALKGWAKAWSQQNVDAYLAYYDAGYAPDGMSRQAWEEERRRRLTRPSWIKVSLNDIEVRASSPEQATVTLSQDYTAAGYHDVTIKRLTLALRDGNWMITSEQNLKVMH